MVCTNNKLKLLWPHHPTAAKSTPRDRTHPPRRTHRRHEDKKAPDTDRVRGTEGAVPSRAAVGPQGPRVVGTHHLGGHPGPGHAREASQTARGGLRDPPVLPRQAVPHRAGTGHRTL